ncbi:MAG: hypothetical protein ACD_73C00046G0002 [uncultured bacterium]|nr:MAG: hypothetical protein ACD_73C00046G0002 [uncultured bacterium]
MLIHCHACQKIFEIGAGGTFKCPYCASLNTWPGEPALSGSLEPELIWERDWKQNPIQSYIFTIQNILLNPVRFFQQLRNTELISVWPLILFVLISQSIGLISSLLLNTGLSLLQPTFMALFDGKLPAEQVMQGLFTPIVMGSFLVIAPFMIIAGLFLSAGLCHLMILLFNASSKGYWVTFRATAYAMGVNVLMIIPILGGIVAGVWQIIVLILGVRELHDTTTGKATLAVLTPYLLFCCVGVGVVGVIITVIASLAMQAGH